MNDSSRTRRPPNRTTIAVGLSMVAVAALVGLSGAEVGSPFLLGFGLLGAGATASGICGKELGPGSGGGAGGGADGGGGGC